MKDLKMWQFVKDNLEENNPVILTIVLESKGSSPGKAGFKIAVTKNRKSFGTIGGGQMEFDLLSECEKLLKTKKKIHLHRKLFHSKKIKKLQSGLVCQGRQTNMTISLNERDLKLIEKIIDSFEHNEPSVLMLSPDEIKILPGMKNENHIQYRFNSEDNWLYEENIGVKNTIYIIGGGHVGLALSNQMELLDFHVVVFDDRADVQTVKENKSADEIIISDYEQVGNFIEDGNYSYVAVVTSALPTDLIVLKQIIGKKLKYIGLMGSDAKLSRIFRELREDGFKPKQLRKVKAPIGIKMSGNTVEEIAVSIAAQIINVKNSLK